MFKNRVVLAIIVIGLGGVFFYLFSSQPTFEEITLKNREEYRNSLAAVEGLLKQNDILAFYSPNKEWIIEGNFEPMKGDHTFAMNMTDSSSENALLAGFVNVKIKGKDFRLMVFDEGEIFALPFKDLSNGNETYGGGRYINIEKVNLKGDKLTVDFNNSHNYYCAYDEAYVCPVPPRENRMDVAVEAGEKKVRKEGF